MIKIWEVGEVEYPEYGDTKPVYYSEEDLKKIASSTSKINLTRNHEDDKDYEIIGYLENFVYKDGALYADAPKGIDLTNYGISPVFDFAKVDKGSKFITNGLKLVEAGLVKNPRSHIYYNNENGDDNMDERAKLLDDIQKNNEEIRNQREEIGTLKARNKKLESSLADKKELEKALKSKEKEFDELKELYESNKSKAEEYDKYTENKKSTIVDELTSIYGDDEQVKERFSKMDLDSLEFFKNHKLVSNPPKGVPSVIDGVNDGTEAPDTTDKDVTYEDYQKWKKEQGIR